MEAMKDVSERSDQGQKSGPRPFKGISRKSGLTSGVYMDYVGNVREPQFGVRL